MLLANAAPEALAGPEAGHHARHTLPEQAQTRPAQPFPGLHFQPHTSLAPALMTRSADSPVLQAQFRSLAMRATNPARKARPDKHFSGDLVTRCNLVIGQAQYRL